MCYREQLPEGCPPPTATRIEATQEFYRLIRADPPTDEDFASWRALHPDRPLPEGQTECGVRGLSLFGRRTDVERRRGLASLRNHQVVCTVTLELGAGRVQRTRGGSHHTWWPLADFDILARCRVGG